MTFKQINPKFALAVLSTSIGSVQLGYHYSVSNNAHLVIGDWIEQIKKRSSKKLPSDKDISLTLSIITSIFFLGGMLGSGMTAFFANKLGPKGGILYNNVIMLAAAGCFFVSRLSELLEMFIVGRFIVGVHVGLNSGLCPIYLAEIAPLRMRGSTIAIYSLFAVFSYSLSQIFLTKEQFLAEKYWYYFVAMGILPGFMQIGALIWCPESPNFIFIREKDEARTRTAFRWLRNSEDVLEDMNRLREYKSTLSKLPEISFKNLFAKQLYRNPLIIALAMVATQQCSAMEIVKRVLYYSDSLMSDAGFTSLQVDTTNTLMAVFLVLTTCLCILTINVIGRRSLFLMSLCGLVMNTVFLLIVLGLSRDRDVKLYSNNITAIALVALTASYGLGTGVIPEVVTVELFHYLARPFANSVAITFGWLCALVINIVYIPVKHHLGIYTFLLNLVVDFLLFVFMQLFLPETNAMNSKQIIQLFYTLDEDSSPDVETVL